MRVGRTNYETNWIKTRRREGARSKCKREREMGPVDRFPFSLLSYTYHYFITFHGFFYDHLQSYFFIDYVSNIFFFYKKLENNPIWKEKANKVTIIALFLIECMCPVCFYFAYMHCGNLLKTS